MQVFQAKAFGQHSTHTQIAVIQIGMHRNHSDVVLDGLHYGAFDVSLRSKMLQTTENKRVVTDDEVTMFGNGFIHDFLSDVQANQGFMCFGIEVANLKTCIVVTLLPLQRRNLSDAVQNVFYGHKFKIEAQN